ncbi:RagB/SusD family nutrient uptake outer membrane protein [Myroides sp.]|uniref:RagB/SusD family nutrient uptake outer membrane protein n=1 Tax=Myroides sp. TaxID=1874736 RepID=UPI003F3626CB
MKKIYYSLFLFGTLIAVSCSKDFAEADQTSAISDSKIAKLAAFPESAMNLIESLESGNYANTAKAQIGGSTAHEDFGIKSIDIALDAMGEDMVFAAMSHFGFHYQHLFRYEDYRGSSMLYNNYAKLAHNANLVMQFVYRAKPSSYKTDHAYGRALALRAYANFNLLRYFEHNGLAHGYEYLDETSGSLVIFYERATTADMKAFIEKDLTSSLEILKTYNSSSKEILSKQAVAGIASRYYLYNKDWTKAQEFSLAALNNSLTAVDFKTLNDGFADLKNPDVLWGFDRNAANASGYASFSSHMDSFNRGYGGTIGAYKMIDNSLYVQINDKDLRKKWFYDQKDTLVSPSVGDVILPGGKGRIPALANLKFYETSTSFLSDYIYMRKSEMLLNYAEAAFESGAIAKAKEALEVLMSSRQEGYSAASFNGTVLRDEIRKQRRIELWGEGFNFGDLRRWNLGIDRKKPGSSHIYVPGADVKFEPGSDMMLFQFPIGEINANPKLRPQNP